MVDSKAGRFPQRGSQGKSAHLYERAGIEDALRRAGRRGLVEEGTGCALSAEEAEGFPRYLEGERPPLYGMMNSWTAQMGQLLANHLGIGWSGTAHTSDLVPLVALGSGAKRFGGLLRNTGLFHHYVALAGIDYRNPELSLMAETGPTAAEVEMQAEA